MTYPLLEIPTLQEAKSICKQIATPFSYSTKKPAGEYEYVFVGYRDAKVTDFDSTIKFNMRELMYIVDKNTKEVVLTHPGHGKFFEDNTIDKLDERFQGAYKPKLNANGNSDTRYFRKLDGTSITSFIHPSSNELMLRTPGSLNNDILTVAKSLVTEELTDLALYLNGLENPAFLCMEYVSPTTPVVEFYSQSMLIVTQVRRYDGSYYSSSELLELMEEYDEVDFNDSATYSPDMDRKIEGYVGVFTNEFGYTSFTKLKTQWYEDLHANRIDVPGNVSSAWIARSYLNKTLGYTISWINERFGKDLDRLFVQYEKVENVISEVEKQLVDGISSENIYKKLNKNRDSTFTYEAIVREWMSASTDIFDNCSQPTGVAITNVMWKLDKIAENMEVDLRKVESDRNQMFGDDDRGSFFAKYKGHPLSNSIIKQLIIPGKPFSKNDIQQVLLNKAKKSSYEFDELLIGSEI